MLATGLELPLLKSSSKVGSVLGDRCRIIGVSAATASSTPLCTYRVLLGKNDYLELSEDSEHTLRSLVQFS